MSANTQLVLEFIRAWSKNDVDAVMEYFAPDCVYHNIPIAPVQGTEAIRAMIEGFLGPASQVEWIVHQVAEAESGCVLTERTDRFKLVGGWIELPVMGVFELTDGKISAWRDYFDMAQYQRQAEAAR